MDRLLGCSKEELVKYIEANFKEQLGVDRETRKQLGSVIDQDTETALTQEEAQEKRRKGFARFTTTIDVDKEHLVKMCNEDEMEPNKDEIDDIISGLERELGWTKDSGIFVCGIRPEVTD